LLKSILLNRKIILNELKFKAIRSSGPGGQHANKVSSKVELVFDLPNSNGLSHEQKHLLSLKLKSRFSKGNVLILQCDESRSQHKNKDLVIKRFLELLKKALVVPKKRRQTKPTKKSVEKRLKSKKKAALKKVNRGKPKLE